MDDADQDRTRPPVVWRPDGSGVLPGGQVGGDVQVGESWSRRFRPDVEPVEGLHAIVEEDWFASDPDPNEPGPPARFTVTCQTWACVCTDPDDPGGTEEWSDYDYHESEVFYPTLEDADRAAKESAEASVGVGIGWDGSPPWHEPRDIDTPGL